MTLRSTTLAIAICAIGGLAFLSSACSDSGSSESTAAASATATTSVTAAASATEAMPTAETHEESFSFGHPADASEADRTIDIEALDTLRFEPDAVTVNVGETVTFKVHNGGQIPHEFGLGTEADQAAHEQEMQQMASSGMAMHDEANGFALMPGETKELTWTFTEAGTVLYGCHEPGHYAGGMKGTITVE